MKIWPRGCNGALATVLFTTGNREISFGDVPKIIPALRNKFEVRLWRQCIKKIGDGVSREINHHKT